MSRIALVVAVARNGVIGRDGSLPWHIPSDLKRFKAITMGKPLIMGRKTWESLPRKPLPGRQNIVVTRNSKFVASGAKVVSSIAKALELARQAGSEEICVIGGGEIYAAAFPLADRLYLTEVDMDAIGDTGFPPIKSEEWRETSREEVLPGAGDSAGFTLRVLDRNT